MWKEFKEFISQGNVLDLAVGVIIGGAFTAIVNSLVNDVIGPILGIILGGLDFSSLSLTVGNAQIMYGNFIQAVINFFIISVIIFLIVKALNQAKKLIKANEEKREIPEEVSEEVLLLREIRDELKKS